MESKPRKWSHLLLPSLLVSLHRSSHAQPATSSTWPAATIKDAFNKTHFSAILIAFLSSIVFLIFLALFILHCVDTYATTRTHISTSPDRRRREAIGRCPVLVYSDVKELRIGNCSALECAVCLIEFEDTDKIRLLPKCNHVFHPDCIDSWFSSRLTCPVCRAKITPSDCAEADADAVTESNHDESSVEDSEIEQLSTVGSAEQPPAETIDAVDEIGSSTGNLPTGTEPRIRPRTAAERFARSHSTGHCLFMESEEVIGRYTLRLPEHVREEIFGKQKRRLRRCASSNDVVLLGEWSLKKGGDHNMER